VKQGTGNSLFSIPCSLLSVTLTPVIVHALAQSVAILTTVLAVAGMGYFIAAVLAARIFLAERRKPLAAFAPSVSVLKSLKGLDRPVAHYHLAAVLLNTGDPVRAKKEYNLALKEDPKSPERSAIGPLFESGKH